MSARAKTVPLGLTAEERRTLRKARIRLDPKAGYLVRDVAPEDRHACDLAILAAVRVALGKERT